MRSSSRLQEVDLLSADQALLSDRWARPVRYLRLSVTERCNYRCRYCAPAEGWPASDREAILSFEEIERLVRVFLSLGVSRVRLTGGEPLVRKGLPDLVARLAALSPRLELTMTSNGDLLDRFAAPLYNAGLRGLNVSLDCVDESRFSSLTGGGSLGQVIKGLESARRVGFEGIKLNAVATRELDPLDSLALCEWAWIQGYLPRFIEEMPIGELGERRHAPRQNASLRALISERYPLSRATDRGERRSLGPARYWVVQTGAFTGQRVGFIDPMSDDGFCARCNRVRLTATGGLRACLADDREVNLGGALRTGASDPDLIQLIKTAIYGKRSAHQLRDEVGAPAKAMIAIGC